MVVSELIPALRRALRGPRRPHPPASPWLAASWRRTEACGFASEAAAAPKKGKKSGATEKDRNLMVVEEALRAPPTRRMEGGSPEEVAENAARAKEYSRRKMAEHRTQRAAESMRLKLKLAAIEALPGGKLREAARVPDYTPFPANRIAAALSPPMRGFIEEQLRESERTATVKKTR